MGLEESSSTNTGFGPDNSDGGRKPGHWQSRYSDPLAEKAIEKERNFLLTVFVISLLLPLVIGLLDNYCYTLLPCKFTSLKKYLFAALGGLLGGTTFSMKWLYHSVAKNIWNIDRRLWRLFTPLLSAVLALVIVVLVNSNAITLTGDSNYTFHRCYGIGFLVGYFSDNAIGKLTEIANVLFGSRK